MTNRDLTRALAAGADADGWLRGGKRPLAPSHPHWPQLCECVPPTEVSQLAYTRAQEDCRDGRHAEKHSPLITASSN